MLIYTFRFFKTKQMRFSSLVDDENKVFQTQKVEKIHSENSKILPKAIEKIEALAELPLCVFGTVPETLKWALTSFLIFLSVNLSQSM